MTSDREHEEGGRGSSAPPPYERGGESTPTPPPYELGEYQAEEPHPYAGMIGDDEEDEDRSVISRAIHSTNVCFKLLFKQLLKKTFQKELEVIALFDYLLTEESLFFLAYFEDQERHKKIRAFRKKIQAYITHYTATPPESPILAGLLDKMKSYLKINHGRYGSISPTEYANGVRCFQGEGLAQPFDKHEMISEIEPYLIKGPDTITLSAADFRLFRQEGSFNPTPCRKVHYGHIILEIQKWAQILNE